MTSEEASESQFYEIDFFKNISKLNTSLIGDRDTLIRNKCNNNENLIITTQRGGNTDQEVISKETSSNLVDELIDEEKSEKKVKMISIFKRIVKQLSNKTARKNSDNGKDEDYIINNIETIYSYFDKNSIIVTFFFWVLFLVSIVNMMQFWTLTYMVSDDKSSFYCFDYHVGDFQPCNSNEFCKQFKKGIKNIYYINNKNITNSDRNVELTNINNNFRSVALYDLVRFSAWNRLKTKKTFPLINRYTNVIAINVNQDFNIFSRYNLVCNNQKVLVLFMFMILLGLVFGLLFGCLADVFGRKKVLFFLMILQIFGNIWLFCFDLLLEINLKKVDSGEMMMEDNILKSNNTFVTDNAKYNLSAFSFEGKIKFDPSFIDNQALPFSGDIYLNSSNINYLRSKINSYSFNMSKFDENFQQKFYFLENSKTKSFIRRKHFFDNLSLVCIGIFLSFGLIPSIYNLCLAFIMELSINRSSTISNYNFFSKSYIVSYLLSYYLSVCLSSYSLSLMIFAFLQLILLLILNAINIESPRYCFELSDWVQLSNIIKDKFLEKDETEFNDKVLEKIIRSKDDPIYMQEIDDQKDLILKRWEIFQESLEKQIFTTSIFRSNKKIERDINKEIILKIDYSNFLEHPMLMWVLIFKHKSYKQLNLLILSMVFNIGIVFYIIVIQFSNDIFIRREHLYNTEIYYNTAVLKNFFVILFSHYVFSIWDQIFGYHLGLSFCYFFMFILSLINGFEALSNKVNSYIKSYISAMLFDYIKNTRVNFMLNMILVNSFFAHGLYFQMFLYITKLSKTISRITYYGFIQLIFYLLFMLSIPLSKYFESNSLFVCQCSFVGFLISYFIRKSDIGTIVKDFRTLERK